MITEDLSPGEPRDIEREACLSAVVCISPKCSSIGSEK